MDTINNLVLKDESTYPDDKILKTVLGDSYHFYLELLELYEKNNLKGTWRYYQDGKAWLCKVQLKNKTIAWMSAWEGYMQATIYLPLRLLEDILNLDIDDFCRDRIKTTKNIGKSKPCIFQIKNRDEILNFEKIMHFKLVAK